MNPTQDAVLNALRTVKYPGYSRDIVSFGLVKEVQVDGPAIGVLLWWGLAQMLNRRIRAKPVQLPKQHRQSSAAVGLISTSSRVR